MVALILLYGIFVTLPSNLAPGIVSIMWRTVAIPHHIRCSMTLTHLIYIGCNHICLEKNPLTRFDFTDKFQT